jgi:hypothetical protein
LVVCLEYVRDIPDISFPSHSGIYQGYYSRHMSLFVRRRPGPGPAVAAMRLERSVYRLGVSWGFNVTATVQPRPPPRPLLAAGGLLGSAAAGAAAVPPRPGAPAVPPRARPRPGAFLLHFPLSLVAEVVLAPDSLSDPEVVLSTETSESPARASSSAVVASAVVASAVAQAMMPASAGSGASARATRSDQKSRNQVGQSFRVQVGRETADCPGQSHRAGPNLIGPIHWRVTSRDPASRARP